MTEVQCILNAIALRGPQAVFFDHRRRLAWCDAASERGIAVVERMPERFVWVFGHGATSAMIIEEST